nr:shufflon system plasmid conjugative transfer pilus tip adhesin PilV [Pseudomonas spelaei]
MAIGLIVLSIVVTLAMTWQIRQMDAQDYRIAADQQRTVAEAQVKYLKDNFSSVLNSASATVPAQITVQMLINTHYLPVGFSPTNVFGQTILGLARKPQPNHLGVIVITTGGQTISEMGIRAIAENLGGSGGFISKVDPNIVQGVRGGWQVALSSYAIAPGPGHTVSALSLLDGALTNDFLYRNEVPGHPEVNAMNTDLGMGNHNINNARDVTARNVTAADTVTAATTHTTGETYTGGWFRTRGDTGWYSEKWGGGIYQDSPDWVKVYNNKNFSTGGELWGGKITSTGKIVAYDRITTNEYISVGGLATEGAACSDRTLIAKSAVGIMLSCQQGVWKGGNTRPGSLASAGTYWGSVTRTNAGTSPIFVTAYGGNGFGGTCGNRYQMTAAVFNGSWITVTDSGHTYDVGSKTTSAGFMVPGGSSYRVTSKPYTCGDGVISLTEFTP